MNSEYVNTILADRYGITIDNTPLLNDHIQRSLKVISELFPMLETAFIATEKNKTRYTVTIPEDELIRVKEVFYNSPPPSTVFNDPDIPLDGISPGASLSQRFTDVFEHETRRALKPVDARIVNINQFDLIPTPQDVRNVYFEYERYRLMSEVPHFLEEELFSLIIFYKNDKAFQDNRANNNGMVFQFNRRGESNDKSSVEEDVKARKSELDTIKREIKVKVNRFG